MVLHGEAAGELMRRRRKVILLISWKESATAPYVCWGTKIKLAGKRWQALRTPQTQQSRSLTLAHTHRHGDADDLATPVHLLFLLCSVSHFVVLILAGYC